MMDHDLVMLSLLPAVDIDGDGFDELIIGAPLLSTKVRYKK